MKALLNPEPSLRKLSLSWAPYEGILQSAATEKTPKVDATFLFRRAKKLVVPMATRKFQGF